MSLNLNCPLTGATSYGIVGLNLLYELDQLGHNVSIFPIGQLSDISEKFHSVIKKSLELAQHFDYNAPCLRIFHQFSMAESIGRGRRIGLPIFELDEFNPLELHHLNSLDDIFVCSKWALDVVWNNLKKLAHLVPLGVDTSIFRPFEPTNADSPYVFLNIAKIEVRKGHDIIIEAFNRAFTEEDNVELWMAWSNPFLKESEVAEWTNYYKNTKLGHKVKFIRRLPTPENVADVIRQSSCGIYPSRAEGWNLPLLETMACNRPVIATNYSAHTEFCNSSNCRLIEPTHTKVAFDGKWFTSGIGKWCEFNLDDLVEEMKRCWRMNLRHNIMGAKTAQEFTWKKSAEKLVEAINVF